MSEDRPPPPPQKYCTEKPIINREKKRRFLNPNFKWNPTNQQLVLCGTSFPPAETVRTNREEFSKLSDCIGSIMMVYENGHTNFASAFRVAPDIWATAQHNLDDEDITESKLVDLYLSVGHEIPSSTLELGITELLNVYEYTPCEVLSKQACLTLPIEEDVDPQSSRAREPSNDFAFLKCQPDGNKNDCVLIPYAGDIDPRMEMAVVGFNLPIDRRFITRMFKDENADDHLVTMQKFANVFNDYRRKSLSPGYVLSANSKLLAHTASTTPGSSGSATIALYRDNGCFFFIGIHVGSWPTDLVSDNNYNNSVSVHHPCFVLEYAQRVYPCLTGATKNLAYQYLAKHTALLQQYNISL